MSPLINAIYLNGHPDETIRGWGMLRELFAEAANTVVDGEE
jgi:hypothetical protein